MWECGCVTTLAQHYTKIVLMSRVCWVKIYSDGSHGISDCSNILFTSPIYDINYPLPGGNCGNEPNWTYSVSSEKRVDSLKIICGFSTTMSCPRHANYHGYCVWSIPLFTSHRDKPHRVSTPDPSKHSFNYLFLSYPTRFSEFYVEINGHG